MEGISIKLKKYFVDMNSVVYKFSGVHKNTVVDGNSVVCKISVKMVDKNSVVAQFSGADFCT